MGLELNSRYKTRAGGLKKSVFKCKLMAEGSLGRELVLMVVVCVGKLDPKLLVWQ